MHAGNTSAGDGPADASDPLVAQINALDGQIAAVERVIQTHKTAHEERIRTLEAQSQLYVRTLSQEKQFLEETREGLRSSQASHGQAEANAAALKA